MIRFLILLLQRKVTGRSGVLVIAAIAVALAASSAAAMMLSAETIRATLQRHIVENSPWAAENVEVRVLSFQPVPLQSGAARLRVLRPVNGIAPGQQNFLIAVENGGKEEAKLWAKVDLRVFQEVVVSSQSLISNEIVTGKEVRLERRDISKLTARPFYRLDEVVGQQVARPITVNETLTHISINRPTLMRRGNAVLLVYENGGIRVEVPGTAEENGRAGELIQVKNPSSGKLLRGRVLDGRIVRIDR
jgi:flagella basal body P-ring formation protein FlgA